MKLINNFFLDKKAKFNPIKCGNSNNNCSKNDMKNKYISNTQRYAKNNKKKVIIKNKLDSNDDILTHKIHNKTDNLNEVNYIIPCNDGGLIKEFKKYSFHKKDYSIPFDLNTMLSIDNIHNINQKIKKELEYKNIKYTIKNDKYYCWKNNSRLIFYIKAINDSNNCYVININIGKQKNNFFNIAFCKEFFGNIVNKNNIY